MTLTTFSGNWVYDVFLSYGEDVRVTFMSHFLKELGRKSITAFKDNNIERSNSIGREQVQAIKDSRIAVVVFSKNYASSRWCLSELLEIVKCEKQLGQLVIPIFYGLDPSHVRKQTGDVGKIFEETCPNITEELKIQLKDALTKVGNTLGYHSAKWDNEAKKIEEITNEVFAKLSSTLIKSDDVEEYVGLEDHIAKMFDLLQLESEEVRMVGIWGCLGTGKSVIARALFKHISRHFQGSVFIDRAFISEIKEIYHGGIADDAYTMKLHLQRTFLSQILGEKDIKVDHLGEVKERLQHQKSLIFIDDLNDQVVLDVLAGSSQWFGSGSRIIVITNDRNLLVAHGISCIYEVGFPSEDLALKMFCRYAFRRNSPPEGFEKLAVEVARHAGRLPLGLIVLGSSLRGKDKEYWMDFLQRIENSLDMDIGKIEEILIMSYDRLTEEDKEIFRHIACLFNLKKVNDIMLLLADSGLDFEKGIRNLVSRSLVNVRSNIVDMHPLLQQIGKEVVRKQSLDYPGEREFLMDAKDICDVLEYNNGTQKIIGISLDIDEIHEDHELYIRKNAFKRMPNLRFLIFFSNTYFPDKKVRLHLPDSFDYLPPKLKLLRWDGYPMESMPSKFCPEHLVMLEMKNSKLEKLWEGSRMLSCLKEMNLWGSEKLKDIPDLSMATNLEKLYISYCLSWVKRPSPLPKFNEQINSGMLEWRNMETRPTDSTNLEPPKRLILREPSHLYLDGKQPLVRRVKTLPSSLKVLFLWDMPNMVELPFFIQNLNKLTDLTIMRCANLATLPTGINLESLERLNVNGCPRLTTFPDLSTNIASLYLEETAITEVPWWIENFSKLKYLQMESCSKLEYVNLNISKLKHLEMVYFSNCRALTGADWNGYISGLALEGENTSSLPNNNVKKVDFRFINCFNLDQEALLRQLSFEKLILSSEEIPLYFTYQTTESSFTNVPLLQAPISPPFFRFRACALVVCEPKHAFGAIGVCMKVTCQFKDRRGDHIDPPDIQKYFSVNQRGSHLLLLDCLFPLSKRCGPLAKVNYEHADIQFHMSSGNSKLKLKRCGIKVHSTDCSSHEKRVGNSNTVPQICEANEDGEDQGDSQRDKRSMKRIWDYMKDKLIL